jgi:tetratricopeptide (TPR) repeat protein
VNLAALGWSLRTVVLTAFGVVVIAGIALGAWLWTAAQERRAAEAYSEVLAQALEARSDQATPQSKAAVAQALEGVMARYPSAAGASLAAFELGNLKYDLREYAAARGAYEVAAMGTASPAIRTLARTAVGYTWEAERNYVKAGEAYGAAAKGLKPKEFFYEDAILALGRAQELAGKKAEAIETYRMLLKDAPGARRMEDVRIRLANLGGTP